MAKKAEISKNLAPKGVPNISTLQVADELIDKINIEKSMILQNALHSGDIDAIYKAQNYLKKQSKGEVDHSKTMIIDPMSLQNGMGYQDKPMRVSLQMLRNMGKVPIIKAIIGTRIEQVCNFSQPQEDKYSTGFVIRPKKAVRGGDGELKLTKEQEKRINFLTEFILRGGVEGVDEYRHDSFETYLRKSTKDSLELDQSCDDLVGTYGGDLYSFSAVDGATIRIADTFFKQTDEEYKARYKDQYVDGYLPFYVQIYMNRIINEYFPWELSMNIRNPQTDIYSNGYGKSELEDLMQLVTNILNADSYNANYFKVGSNPKGILRVTGNVNTSRLEEFKMQWQSQVAGVRNSHKLPVIEADKMDFINTQASNKDMEWGKYYEFLIKVGCAVYKIDPSEINFNMSGNGEGKMFGEGGNEAKLKHSKDKGLKPLLRFRQNVINKTILSRIDKDYEFIFVGLEQEDRDKELEDLIKKVQNIITVNEARRKLGMKDISDEDGGNMILNPQLMSMKQQKQMMDQQGQMGQGNQDQDNPKQFLDDEYGSDKEDENPFTKSLGKEIEKILA